MTRVFLDGIVHALAGQDGDQLYCTRRDGDTTYVVCDSTPHDGITWGHRPPWGEVRGLRLAGHTHLTRVEDAHLVEGEPTSCLMCVVAESSR